MGVFVRLLKVITGLADSLLLAAIIYTFINEYDYLMQTSDLLLLAAILMLIILNIWFVFCAYRPYTNGVIAMILKRHKIESEIKFFEAQHKLEELRKKLEELRRGTDV